MTIQYYFTCKNKINTQSGWMKIVVLDPNIEYSVYLSFGCKTHYNCAVNYKAYQILNFGIIL